MPEIKFASMRRSFRFLWRTQISGPGARPRSRYTEALRAARERRDVGRDNAFRWPRLDEGTRQDPAEMKWNARMGERTSGLHRIVTVPAFYSAIQRLLGGERGRGEVATMLRTRLSGRSVVEIGCGPGTWVPELDGVRAYLGIDHNPDHISVASSRYAKPGVSFVCASLDDDSSFDFVQEADAVLAVGILHHLDDDVARRTLRRAAERLPPGALYVGIEPVLHHGQNPVARLLKALDSGRNIRTEEGYRSLFDGPFDRIETSVRRDLMRVPYSHCFITAVTAPRS
jgi:SAM-dependent methyltransferase